MPNLIDWNFIGALEGAGILNGYVPDPANSKSGVTIATGFDIGQRSDAELANLFGAGSQLYNLFKPYAGLKKYSAVNALRNRPLKITAAQAATVDTIIKTEAVNTLVRRYDQAVGLLNVARQSGQPPKRLKPFFMLPREAQTVIASVAFQYGHLKSETPDFWKQVTEQRWMAAYRNLRNFGDLFQKRRWKEAAYLLPLASAQNNPTTNTIMPQRRPTLRPPNHP